MAEPTRDQLLKNVLSQIRSQLKDETAIMRLGESALMEVPGIPTGALSLDIALGGRGMPRGRVIEIFGPESSGKTTVAERLAARLGWRFLEGDRLHPPANVEKMRQGIPLTDADRAPWLDMIGEELKRWAVDGRAGVLTCSALKRAYRDRIRAARPDVRFAYVKGSQALIEARVAARHHEYMPASLLKSQFDALEEPAPDEPAVTIDASGSPDTEVAAVIAALGLDRARRP